MASMNALQQSIGQNKKYTPISKTPFEVALSQMGTEDLLPAVIDREKETLAQRKARFEKDALVF
jgi:RNA polymerase sigma-70 factor (ECF subfamily)